MWSVGVDCSVDFGGEARCYCDYKDRDGLPEGLIDR
jgi:hypothetical protein